MTGATPMADQEGRRRREGEGVREVPDVVTWKQPGQPGVEGREIDDVDSADRGHQGRRAEHRPQADKPYAGRQRLHALPLAEDVYGQVDSGAGPGIPGRGFGEVLPALDMTAGRAVPEQFHEDSDGGDGVVRPAGARKPGRLSEGKSGRSRKPGK